MPVGTSTSVRLAELVATLSLAADLGLGQPMEHCLRQTRDRAAARRPGRAPTSRSSLRPTTRGCSHVYCHADAHEQAKWFGDDIALKAYGFEGGVRVGRRGAAPGRLWKAAGCARAGGSRRSP